MRCDQVILVKAINKRIRISKLIKDSLFKARIDLKTEADEILGNKGGHYKNDFLQQN